MPKDYEGIRHGCGRGGDGGGVGGRGWRCMTLAVSTLSRQQLLHSLGGARMLRCCQSVSGLQVCHVVLALLLCVAGPALQYT